MNRESIKKILVGIIGWCFIIGFWILLYISRRLLWPQAIYDWYSSHFYKICLWAIYGGALTAIIGAIFGVVSTSIKNMKKLHIIIIGLAFLFVIIGMWLLHLYITNLNLSVDNDNFFYSITSEWINSGEAARLSEVDRANEIHIFLVTAENENITDGQLFIFITDLRSKDLLTPSTEAEIRAAMKAAPHQNLEEENS